MQIIALCNKKENIDQLLQSKADIVAIGCNKFSDKTQAILAKEEFKSLLDKAKAANKKLYAYLDAFIYDIMIPELEELLVYFNEIKLDGVIFNDLGINQICFEKNLSLDLIYDPKALITNYEQFPFFKKNKIDTVVLANELKEKEVIECCQNKKDMKLAKQVSGYVFIMESRWQLITEFLKKNQINADLNDKKVYIKEETREFPSIIHQNEFGTHIYTGYVLSNMQYLKELNDAGLDFILIDGLLHSDEWLNKTIDVYSKAINDFSNTSKYVEEEKAINKDEFVSSGFISNNPKDLKYVPENTKEELE